MSQLNMSRRGFVKAAAATGALAAFGATAVDGATFREAHADETTSQTKKVTPHASVHLQLRRHRDGARQTRHSARGNPEAPSAAEACARGLSGIKRCTTPVATNTP
ncbi:MAG: twin-arginine translocation signal domain-containing protein [Eggerthellaceae bacterium]